MHHEKSWDTAVALWAIKSISADHFFDQPSVGFAIYFLFVLHSRFRWKELLERWSTALQHRHCSSGDSASLYVAISLMKRRWVKRINHILERSSPFLPARRRYRSSLISWQKDRDVWFVWVQDSLASVPVFPSLCMIEQMSQSLVNGWQSNRDVLRLKSVGLGAGPLEIVKFNQYRSKGSTFFFFFL